jgi:hypothetical protein
MILLAPYRLPPLYFSIPSPREMYSMNPAASFTGKFIYRLVETKGDKENYKLRTNLPSKADETPFTL